MSQTAYTTLPDDGIQGQLADQGFKDSVSRAAEAALAFGKPVVEGTAPEQVLLPSAAGQNFQGVSMFRHQEDRSLAGDLGVPADGSVDILTKGRIWVTVEVAVTKGEEAFYRHTDNGPLLAGGWTNVDDAETDPVHNAKFVTSASAGELAILSINDAG